MVRVPDSNPEVMGLGPPVTTWICFTVMLLLNTRPGFVNMTSATALNTSTLK